MIITKSWDTPPWTQKERPAYPSLMCSLHKLREVFHPPLRVWVLEQHSTDIFPAEVHFMG